MRRRLTLPNLLDACLSWCQDEQAGLTDAEADRVREAIEILRQFKVRSPDALRRKLAYGARRTG